MTSEQYRTYLTESIKIGAQMMHDMAEDIAGRSDFISNLKVTIEFDPEIRSIALVIYGLEKCRMHLFLLIYCRNIMISLTHCLLDLLRRQTNDLE